MMRLRVGLVRLVLGAVPMNAAADENPGPGGQKTAVYMQAGYSSGSWNMGGPALGGMLVGDLTSRLSVEALASYLPPEWWSLLDSAVTALGVRLVPTP